MTTIPLFDCRLPDEALAAVEGPFRSGRLAAGPAVAELEQRLGARFAGHHAVALSDMTHALALALRLAGVREGDEVLSLAFNCMSSNSAIAMTGGRVTWVDIDPATASFDVDHARSRLTARTRAVIVYHVSGYPADLISVRRFCDEHGLVLIEDANNAFGASVGDHAVGTVGDFAIFSLYANRQINAIDGGILLCRSQEEAERARRLRRFGIDTARFRDQDGEIDPLLDVPEIGTSSTLNNVHATLALTSLGDVDVRIAQSRRNVAALTDATGGFAIAPITPVAGGNPVYWTWLIRLDNRDTAMRALKARGVLCSKLHYPNHHYTGFAAPATDLPGTMALQEQMLAIPCGWWIEEATIPHLAETIGDAVRAAR